MTRIVRPTRHAPASLAIVFFPALMALVSSTRPTLRLLVSSIQLRHTGKYINSKLNFSVPLSFVERSPLPFRIGNDSPLSSTNGAGIETTWARSTSPLDPYQFLDTFSWPQSRSQSVKNSDPVSQIPGGAIYSSFAAQAESRVDHENLQKSRRRCIDFGLGRTPTMSQIPPSPPPLCLDDSDLVSPPLTHGSNNSDTSSLFDGIDIEMMFPRPPPIFTSLRRVRSSPLLAARETSVTKNVMKKHRADECHDYASSKHQSALSKVTPHTRHWDGPNGHLEELVLDLEGEALLSSKASAMNAIQSQLLVAHTRERGRPHVQVTLSASRFPESTGLYSPSRLNGRCNTILCDSEHTLSAIESKASAMIAKGKKLSHSRSTSSLLPLPRITQKSFATFGPTRKTYSKAKSIITLAASVSPVYPESNRKIPEGLCPGLLDCLEDEAYQADGKHVPHHPSLACLGRQKTTKRTHLPNSFTGLSFSNASRVPPTSLGSPFHHRSDRSHSVDHAMTTHPSPYVPKSFIDITPEQEICDFTSRPRRELMRTWLVRASRGVLNWGQTLIQRPKHTGMHET